MRMPNPVLIRNGNLLDAETADLIAARGAFLVPILVTYQTVAESGRELGFPEVGMHLPASHFPLSPPQRDLVANRGA